MMSQVLVDNQLYINNPTDDMYKWCHDNLILDNPDYIKKLKMNKWLGGTSEYIYLYQIIGDKLVIPFGCLQRFHQFFSDQIEYRLGFSGKSPASYQSKINLYDYQERAVKSALRLKNGILVMPCGSGKTQTAIEIISRIGGTVLWLTHTQDLLNQSKLRAESVLDTDCTFGTITNGKVDIGTGITFATVQTMSKLNLSEYKHFWDMIIVDECQHCCGSPTRVTQFYKVISALSARYKFGLTATPRRADGLHESMFALLGGVIHEVSRKEVEQNTCPIQIIPAETGYQPDYNNILMGDGTLDYNALTDDLINNKERFQKVLDCINTIGKSILVLGNRVQYIQNLHEEFSGRSVCLSTLGQSTKAKAERKEILRKLNDDELDAVFATYQLAKEGLDVPNLQYVIFATPVKDEITVIQSVGRVGRKAEGKRIGTVIDFVDDFSLYRRYFAKRKSCYRKIEAKIIDV